MMGQNRNKGAITVIVGEPKEEAPEMEINMYEMMAKDLMAAIRDDDVKLVASILEYICESKESKDCGCC